MKKKHLILWAGLLVVLLLLGLSCAAAEQQPSKSAAEWKNEGYQVIYLADLDYGSDAVEGFIVLRNDIHYLTEKSNGGITVSGNTFTCSNYQTVQEGNGDNAKMYCIVAGGKLYFGEVESVNGGTVRLKSTIPVESMDGMPGGIITATAPYTVGAWINKHFPFEFNQTVEGIPFYFKGEAVLFLDHWSHDPGKLKPTEHTIQYYWELNLSNAGFKTDSATSGEIRIPLAYWNHIKILFANVTMDNYRGQLDVNLSIHDGVFVYFDTFYITAWLTGIAEDGPLFDIGTNQVRCIGNADIGLELGASGTPLPGVIENESLTIGGGVSIKGQTGGDRFVPADTKEKWHSCDECWYEEIHGRVGPLKAIMDLIILDPWEWNTPTIDFDPFYDWHYSKTWDEWGDGHCGRYSYRLNTNVVTQKGKAIQNVDVVWPTDTAYKPQASGTTDASGQAVIYVSDGDQEITATATSPRDPSWTITQTQKISKSKGIDNLTITLDIPENHVYFKNSATGQATDWPKDIDFMPFFTEDVQLPDTIPGLSGRQFISWNTAQDGSGTSYAPGTKLTLSEDLTLWAQWKPAGDDWYVVYNANGGTKAPSPQIVPHGQDAVLTTELPESGKLIFKGWTPDLKALEPVYQPGDTLPYDSEKNVVVLYAMWELSPVVKPIHITFDANGAEGASLPADVWLEKGTWMQLGAAIAPLGSDYTFLGWSEDPGAETPEYQAGQSYYFFRDTALYAIWDNVDTKTLTFKDSLTGAASGIPDPITILATMSPYVQIPSQIPQRDGMAFTAWNTASDGSGTSYAPGSVFNLQKSAVLWAQWSPLGTNWFVVYNANGGTNAPGTQMVSQGEDAVLSSQKPKSGDLVFKGWTPDLQTMDPIYQPGDKLPYTSGKNYVVLYALWNLDPVDRPVTITFDANGGKADTVPNKCSAPKGETFNLPAQKPTWDAQHDFLGWSANQKATAPDYKPGDRVSFEQDTKLYAIWNAHYKVIEGSGSVWTKGSGVTQRFVADGNRQYFKELRVDGSPFMTGVTISSGSTIADISAGAMERLSVGGHTVTFVYIDGEASAPFTVYKNPPKTGDTADFAGWLLALALGTAGLLGILGITRKKRRNRS